MLCNQCGTPLPDQAKFCLNCGSPVAEVPEPQPGFTPRQPAPPPELDFVQPALAGGMFLGLLSSIPVINAGNCLCCMWILGGGGLAAFMLTKQRPNGQITYGDAAFGGVTSGVFGAIVATLISIPMRMLMARFMTGQREAMEEAMAELPIEGPMRDLILSMASADITFASVAFMFFTNLLMYCLFAMIGGILTLAILQKHGKS